ncbi:zinc-dependent alcohol dehydrogenase family protein [Rhizobium jaguaris]|uniref:enoyl-[acyl-carrier-protein] reductase n=1 Tax=Rhizobium jaguaris TaxID=1312183 RepID=A0A387FPZ4_9HYPH|nr:zinc-dependent alcohol dehydrogenase family protein [Rhizobium jaguaris]AYG59707.1 alcohol dehydrogenase [Rhizobium jaguaris]
MLAIHLNAYGDPAENLELVNLSEPPAPGSGEVLVGVEYSPINPADLLLAMGYYALRPALPSVIGNEGVGSVLAIGAGVTNVKIGDRIIPPLSSFLWRERLVLPAKGLAALPSQADPKQLAMLAVNPVTAALLLSEFKTLKPGDWIVQSAANSGVGRSVIAYAQERGLRTINIVRREELVADLKAKGGDVVLVDGPDIVERAKAPVGNADIAFALDCLSGPATAMLGSILSQGGTLVSYGAMSGMPITVNPGDMIYKALTIRSFFLGHEQYAAKLPALIQESANLVASGKLHVPVAATYPLTAIKDAVAHAKRGGKILLDISGD